MNDFLCRIILLNHFAEFELLHALIGEDFYLSDGAKEI